MDDNKSFVNQSDCSFKDVVNIDDYATIGGMISHDVVLAWTTFCDLIGN